MFWLFRSSGGMDSHSLSPPLGTDKHRGVDWLPLRAPPLCAPRWTLPSGRPLWSSSGTAPPVHLLLPASHTGETPRSPPGRSQWRDPPPPARRVTVEWNPLACCRGWQQSDDVTLSAWSRGKRVTITRLDHLIPCHQHPRHCNPSLNSCGISAPQSAQMKTSVCGRRDTGVGLRVVRVVRGVGQDPLTLSWG